MALWISLLRGINVLGSGRITMDDLRAVYANLGLDQPRTYLQSGNVVFNSRHRRPAPLAARIRDGIHAVHGFRPHVILRTPAELAATVAANPFANRAGIDPSRFLVYFVQDELSLAAAAAVRALNTATEVVMVGPRCLYIYCPNGIGQAKLPWPRLDQALAVPATGRNWNTVRRLHCLATGED